MEEFDPLRTRQRLEDPVRSGVHYGFKDVGRENSPVYLANTSQCLVQAYVHCVLGGADPSIGDRALVRARAHAGKAVDLYRERLVIPESGPIDQHTGIDMYTMATAVDTLLLRAWLCGETPPPGLADGYARLTIERFLRSPADDVAYNPSVALAVVPLMGHGLWGAVRTLVEAHPRFGTDKFKPQRPTQVAYRLATEPAQRHDPKSPALRKGAAHLRAHVHDLADAHVSRFLHWLRVIEWREGTSGLTPRQVLLRAYAYMPDVAPPASIADEVTELRAIKF